MDKALKGLLVKEWKMMKGFLIGMYVIAIILLLVIIYFSDAGEAISGGLEMMMVLGVMIIPASFLFSLNSEVIQMQSFLHTPQSAHKILLSKVIYSTAISITYLFILSLGFTGLDLIQDFSSFSSPEVFKYTLYTSGSLVIVSLYLTGILLFLWSLHQIWRTYIGGLSILLIIILMIVGSQVSVLLKETTLYTNLTEWGHFSFPAIRDPQNTEWFFNSFSIGSYLFAGLFIIILYFISAYLLDRKVEA